MSVHKPCAQCGFPVDRTAARCPDCGTRTRGWLRGRRSAGQPLRAIEARLATQVSTLRDRRIALEQARATALQRLQGAPPERVVSLTALVRRAELGLAQVAGLVARCNQARTEVGARRHALVDDIHRAEWLQRLQRNRPTRSTFAPVQVARRWQDTSLRHGVLISPSGRRAALVGGGDVLLVDMDSGRAQRIAASGASGLCFSADERCLRFPDGRLWGCHQRRWMDHHTAWLPPAESPPILLLDRIPYTQEQAAPDPRWCLRITGGQCDLVEPLTGWFQPLLVMSSQHALTLQGGVLIATDRDARRTVLYGLSAGPELRWDAWRLLGELRLADHARAVVIAGLTEELQQLARSTEDIGVRTALLAVADRHLDVPGLARQVALAAEAALSAACFSLVMGEGPAEDRARALERLGQVAAVAAELCTDPDGRMRLRTLAAQTPSWVDGLIVEAASGSLVSLTGGEAIRGLQRRSAMAEAQLQALAMPPGAGRVEPPDPEIALAELAQIQADISAQLVALEEAEGAT